MSPPSLYVSQRSAAFHTPLVATVTCARVTVTGEMDSPNRSGKRDSTASYTAVYGSRRCKRSAGTYGGVGVGQVLGVAVVGLQGEGLFAVEGQHLGEGGGVVLGEHLAVTADAQPGETPCHDHHVYSE